MTENNSQNERRQKRKNILLIFAIFAFIGVALRIFYLIQYSASPLFDTPLGPDVSEYYDWANEIRAGSFLWSELKIHSPLYAYFLAILLEICLGIVPLARFIQSMFFLFSGLLFFFILFGKDGRSCEIRTGIVASFIFAIYPPIIYLSSEFYSESLIIPLICLTIIFQKLSLDPQTTKKNIFSVLFGLFSALILLTHPLATLFVLANFAFFLISQRTKDAIFAKKISLISLSIFFIVLLPVSLYNGIKFGKIFPFQANSGYNFYLGNNPDSDGTCYIRPGPDWDKIHDEAKYAVEGTNLSTDQYFFAKSLNFVVKNPLHWIALLLKKTFLIWNKTELISGADLSQFRYFTPFQRATRFSFAIIGTLSLSFLLFSFFSRRKISSSEKILLILLFSFWTAQIFTVTSSRYRAAMLPTQIFLASLFLTEIRNFIKAKPILPLFAFTASFIIVCLFPTPIPKNEKAEYATILAEAYLEKGDMDKSATLLSEAINLEPRWSRNYNMLGLIHQKKANYQEAKRLFFCSLNCSDSDKSALLNLALLFSQIGEKESSESFWKEALKEKPNANLLYNYSLKLQKDGDLDGALKYSLQALKLQPNHLQALNNTGVILMMKNRQEDALEYFQKAFKFTKNKFDIGINLAVCLYENKKIEKAEKILRKIAPLAKTPEQKEKLAQTIQIIAPNLLP